MPLIVESLNKLPPLKSDWLEIYDADPEANIFISWNWMETWLGKAGFQWFVLGARPEGQPNYVALFPLQLITESNPEQGFYNDIRMAGLEFADYTGLLCKPEYEEEVLPAFAHYLRELNWTRLHFRNFPVSDHRYRLLTKGFAPAKFTIRDIERVGADNLDSNIYPYAALPGDWDTYCNEKLSSNTRQKARRFLRRVDESGEFRITHTQQDTLERDVKILMQFWEQKWAEQKGEKMRSIRSNNMLMMRSCFAAQALLIAVLWKGEQPLAAHALLLDHPRKAARFMIGGRDETFNSPPPGFILHAYGIKWAIENGFNTYDFLQGNEAYKYMWGAEDRRVKCLVIGTKSNRNLHEKLDKQAVPSVIERAKELHDKGELVLAERGYRQILEVEPEHGGALYFLAQLLTAKRDYPEAEKCLKALLAAQPQHRDGWFKLGKICQARADNEGALRSYRKVLELDPQNRDVPPLLAELSPQQNLLRNVLGPGPSWAKTDGDDDLLKRFKSK